MTEHSQEFPEVPENIVIVGDPVKYYTNIEYIHLYEIPTVDKFWELFKCTYQINLLSVAIPIFNVIFYIDLEIPGCQQSYELIAASIEEYQENTTRSLNESILIRYDSGAMGLYVDITA